MTPFGTTLVKKLVNVMERVEKLPLYLYESPGAMYGLQVLTRRYIMIGGPTTKTYKGIPIWGCSLRKAEL